MCNYEGLMDEAAFFSSLQEEKKTAMCNVIRQINQILGLLIFMV